MPVKIEAEGHGNGLRNDYDVAIVGMSARLPMANDVDTFWNLMTNGVDFVTQMPAKRDKLLPGIGLMEGAYLDCNVEEFDAGFFNVSEKEACCMDPQLRILLEVCWESLEDSRIPPSSLHGTKTGIFMGIVFSDYLKLVRPLVNEKSYLQEYMGNEWSGYCGRISNFFGIHGPSIASEAGCASSALSIHHAVTSLRMKESEVALVGGTNVLLTRHLRTPPAMLSNRCRPFDASASGFIAGEAVIVIVMKLLGKAIENGDRILGVIRGSSTNHDGGDTGLGTPSAIGQIQAIQTAINDAGVDISEISLLETHGTGTKTGDPVEVGAIATVYKSKKNPLILSSTKAYGGHALSSAGLLSLVKVLCCLKYRLIPKQLHLKNLNPAIHLDEFNGVIPKDDNLRWESPNGTPLIAGINSFAFAGVNVHLILQEPPQNQTSNKKNFQNSHNLLTLSAKSAQALHDLSSLYSVQIQKKMDLNLDDLAYSSQVTRDHHTLRRAIVFKDRDDLLQKLEETSDMSEVELKSENKSIVFLFTGQGSQVYEMGKDLYETSTIFKSTLDKCEAQVKAKLGGVSMKEIMWTESSKHLLNQSLYSQIAIFCIEVSLYEVWRAGYGMSPNVVLGHSLGEFGAAVAAGILSLDDALDLVIIRSQLFAQLLDLSKGGACGMMATSFSKDDLIATLENYKQKSKGDIDVELAVTNTNNQTVVSGTTDSLNSFKNFVNENYPKINTKILGVDYAFHSHHIDKILNEYRQTLQKFKFNPPTGGIKYISSTTGTLVTAEEVTNVDYWIAHTRQPVNFLKATQTLLELVQGPICIEIGPQPILLKFVGDEAEWKKVPLTLCPSVRALQPTMSVLLTSLGKIYTNSNVHIPWDRLEFNQGRRLKIDLPYYPFNRQTYWISHKFAQINFIANSDRIHPLLGNKIQIANSSNFIFNTKISPHEPKYLHSHRIGNDILFPMAAYLEMMLGTARSFSHPPYIVKNVAVTQKLQLSNVSNQLQLQFNESNGGRVEIYSRENNEEDKWALNCRGMLEMDDDNVTTAPENMSGVIENFIKNSKVWDATMFYKNIIARGCNFGPEFQLLTSIRSSNDDHKFKFLTEITYHAEIYSEIPYILPPNLLDGIFQSFLAPTVLQSGQDIISIPVGVNRVEVYQMLPPGTTKVLYVCIDSDSALLCDRNGHCLAKLQGFKFLNLKAGTQVSAQDFQQFDNNEEEEVPFYLDKWVSHSRVRTANGGDLRKWDDVYGDTERFSSLKTMIQIGENLENEFHTRLDKISYLYILKLIYAQGWEPKLNEVFPKAIFNKLAKTVHPKYVESLLNILVEEGILEHKDTNSNDWIVAKLPPPASELPQDSDLLILSDKSTIEYKLLKRFADLFGKESVKEILSGDKLVSLDRYVSSSKNSKLESEIFIKGILEFCSQAAAADDGFVLRILEVKGGNGDLGKLLLKELNRKNISYEFTFTDSSLNSINKAKETFSTYGKNVKVEILDIEKDPSFQGFQPRSYHIVLASKDILHTTKNIKNILCNVQQLICETGLLLFAETFKKDRWRDIIYGLMENWTGFNDFRVHSPLLDFNAWCKVVEECGFINPVPIGGNEIMSPLTRSGWIGARVRGDFVGNSQPGWIIISSNNGSEEVSLKLKDKFPGSVVVGDNNCKKNGIIGMDLCSSQLDIFDSVRALNKSQFLGVIYLANLSQEFPVENFQNLTENAKRSTQSLLNVLQTVGKVDFGKKKVILVTKGSNVVQEDEKVDPLVGILSAFFNTFGNEYPEIITSHLDFSLDEGIMDLDNIICNIYSNCWSNEVETERRIAIRNGLTYVQEMVENNLTVSNVGQVPLFNSEGTYLIVGGLGGIGYEVAKWMLKNNAGWIVLTGRSEPSDDTKIRALGPNVSFVRADVSNENDVRNLIKRIQESCKYPLKGIFQGAGIPEASAVALIQDGAVERTLSAKVFGTWLLHHYTMHLTLDYFVTFSTISTPIGTKTLGMYAGANAFMDNFIQYRRNLGLCGLSINWGAWSDVGMAVQYAATANQESSIYGCFNKERGIQALERAMYISQFYSTSRIIAAELNLSNLFQTYPKLHRYLSPLKNSMMTNGAAVENGKVTENSTSGITNLKRKGDKFALLTEEVKSTSDDKLRVEKIQALIEHCIRYFVGLPDTTTFDRLESMGLSGYVDSLVGMEVRGKLYNLLHIQLPSGTEFNSLSINALANSLNEAYIG